MAEKTLEQVLTKAPRAKGDGNRLGLYVVLTGDDATIVRAALVKIGVDGNLAAFARQALLNEIKRRLAKPEVAK